MSSDDPTVPARVRWAALFDRSDRPLFVLGRHRRIRYVNPAWERLTGRPLADVWGKACVRTGPTEPLFRTLSPPPEAVAGATATVRRPAPGHAAGPPWWELTVVPLEHGGVVGGYLGLVRVIADGPASPGGGPPALVTAARERHAAGFPFDLFAGTSPAAESLLSRIRLAAQTAAPVWIAGEPGCGKETLARVVHHNGPRRDRPFVAVECGGLQPYLLESLLFGRGGVGLLAGTLYLKNPAALPRDLQQRLADFLLSPNSPRPICGSTAASADEARAGTLRPEFHAALSVIELRPLPLRDRLDELPRLIDRLLDRHDPKPAANPDLLPVLRAHRWPGNLRELADVLATNPRTPADLPRYVRERALLANDPRPPAKPRPTLDEVLTAVEARMIRLALREANGNQTDAAAKLGVFRARLGRRIEALGLSPPGER